MIALNICFKNFNSKKKNENKALPFLNPKKAEFEIYFLTKNIFS
jgi:hypothetical protein